MKSDGIDGDEGLFTRIATKRGETVEECAQGRYRTEGDERTGELVRGRQVSALFFRV